MLVEMRPIASIRPYENNPRLNDAAVDAVAASIQAFGFRQPIVVDENGVIIVGHTRYLAALKLGMTTVPVHVAVGLTPAQAKQVVVLAQPVEDEHAAVLALLGDGEAWSSSALALALDSSQRTVQRALDALLAAGKVQALGRGRARRWITPPLPGIATTLLLPAALPGV